MKISHYCDMIGANCVIVVPFTVSCEGGNKSLTILILHFMKRFIFKKPDGFSNSNQKIFCEFKNE